MTSNVRLTSFLLAGAAMLTAPHTSVARQKVAPPQDKPAPESVDPASEADTLVVTGSRIRGAPIPGELTILSRDTITAAGQIDLGEALRALPQNFGGGQNPGIGNGAGLANTNVNSASSVNLRGLGADATLTLLNGHRLPSDGAFGGVDISAIPLAALDRVEVVPDAASALYGSDAVAGVVNVILRRDYEGITTSAQLGASTDGGYVREQADVVAGTRWTSGGVLISYDFAHNSAISANQRSYTGTFNPTTSLYPSTRRHAVTLSAHQEIAAGVTASIDATYSSRASESVGGTPTQRYLLQPKLKSFTVAPSFEVTLGAGWTVKAIGVLGRDRTRYLTTITPTTGAPSNTNGCFCNRAASAEVGAEGPLFALPGGNARAAFGAGYRSNGMAYTRFSGTTPLVNFDVTRDSRFAYGEIYLPVISTENAISGIERLSVSGAVRYEDYPGMARLATPRFGLIYAPVAGLTLRGTWSRSFKAPTLYQQYVPYEAYLLPAAAFGAGSAGRTVFYTSGGNPGLKPERARSWTAGFELRPVALPNLTLEATWFDIRYSDRVLQPIAGSIAAAFIDPGYATLINRAPTASLLASLIAGADPGLQNFSGAAYDPANVVALVDNRNINVAAQKIHGIDARIAWNGDVGPSGKLSLDLAGTWLESDQQLTRALPDVKLAGTVFSPPHVRFRATAGYQAARFRISSSLNYTGALADRRFSTASRIAPSATVDLGLRYDIIPGRGGEPGLAVSLQVNNAFNRKPDVIRTTGPTDTPYDSTNYSSIGRFVAVGVTRHW